MQQIDNNQWKIKETLSLQSEEICNKCSIDEVDAIKNELSRFALYDDYKGLFERVVPPVN
jgi:molecular chaperone DnaK (HSP70)